MTGADLPPGANGGPAGTGESPVAAVLSRLATAYPGTPSAGEDLSRSLRFLGWRVDPETVVAAGYVVGALVAVALAPVALVVGPPYRVAVPPGLLVAGLGATHAVHRLPPALAAVRRTTALGDAPGLLARAVLRMRIEPTVESAVEFAARSGRGRLAASLRRHVRRTRGTPRSGLSSFADEWAEWFPALRRSSGLVVAAADAPAGERSRTLDRALTAMLDGTRDRMATFADRVRGPATALYAFGVLLPLALVAVLPAAHAAGISASLELLVVVYDLVLPAVVLAASAWLLVRRPVAFPPPQVGRDHPEVPGCRWPPVALGGVVAATALLAGRLVVPAWSVPVAAVGAGAGTALVGLYRPIVAVREDVRAVEEGLPDALYLVGRRVAEGEAVETALERAAEEVSGRTGETLGEAVAVGRRLRVDVRESFLGDSGALADVPSPRARGTAALLAAAAEEGRPAGGAVVAMAEHLGELDALEREARRELAQVTGTLQHTAAVFGPLVAGATVALSAGMGSPDLGGATGEAARAVPTGALGTAIGAYVLFLAAVLTALSVGLQHGLDRPLVGYRVGQASLSATAVYLLAHHFVGLLV